MCLLADGFSGSAVGQDSRGILGTSTPVNYRPIADVQDVTTRRSVAVEIFLSGYDANGDGLTFTGLTDPSDGTLSGFDETTGRVVYTPDSGFVGSDEFEFAVDDGIAASAPATVSILVEPGFGGALTGTWVAFAGCLNLTTGQFVRATVNADRASWDCEGAGLSFASGDSIAIFGIGWARAIPNPVGGSVTGAAPRGAVCTNKTSGQKVFARVATGETSWDCEAAGLVVVPGNVVRVLGLGWGE